MDIEDLHLACLADIPEGGGPCRLELEDLALPKKQPAHEDGPKMFARVTETDRARALQRPPLILSCSRRTDVPWAFLRQYLKAFREGFMYVRSPVTRRLQHAQIHVAYTLVLCTAAQILASILHCDCLCLCIYIYIYIYIYTRTGTHHLSI